ncbi:hypothetical protein DK847_07310 [Aestuariivirga litoralis]|uniref:Uncharacterized protein n=1 Tax=Aestuariivirga litoralis TaxID=2650924 RepID=A0A2W2CAD8_9HYPH|nr:hypothetical protein [Aestuariivirga litoralis]PZF77133.1 hypothetical protein DK847_07310 [Aestuariivirga litoralis]
MPITRYVPSGLVLCLALLVSAGAPAAAHDGVAVPSVASSTPAASPARPMAVRRMQGTGPCGSRCPEWIMAEGTITPNTPSHLRELLGQAEAEKLPVVFESKGGDLDAALEIGRMIRAAGLTTVIGHNVVEGCGPREACSKDETAGTAYRGYVAAPAECSGTCLFAFAGGVRRIGYWATGASLPALDGFKSRSRGARAGKLIGDYLADMGISAGLVVRLRQAGLTLGRSDMLHFGLSTGRERVEDVTGTSICHGRKPAANCLLKAAPAPAQVSMAASPRKQAAPRPGQVIIWGALE